MLHSLIVIPDEKDLEIVAEVDPYSERLMARFSMVAPEQEDFLWALERLAMQIMKNVAEARARR